MGDLLVYHNPRCSKSRGALELLDERGAEVAVVEYLVTPPGPTELAQILEALEEPPGALVRHDDRFRELGLDPDGYETRDAVLALLLEHPELLQRPVVLRDGRAVIGRPPERVLALLDE